MRWRAALDESAPLGIIPNLADDLFDQIVTQGAGFEFQIPLHQMKTMSVVFERVLQPGLQPSCFHRTATKTSHITAYSARDIPQF